MCTITQALYKRLHEDEVTSARGWTEVARLIRKAIMIYIVNPEGRMTGSNAGVDCSICTPEIHR